MFDPPLEPGDIVRMLDVDANRYRNVTVERVDGASVIVRRGRRRWRTDIAYLSVLTPTSIAGYRAGGVIKGRLRGWG